MKTCSDCLQEITLSEFYTHPNTGNHYGRCKQCHSKKTNSYAKSEPHPHEIEIANKLKSSGVPVMFGKQFVDRKYKNVDLVVYGVYKVECKLPVDNRVWLTKKQLNRTYANFVILIYGEHLYLMSYEQIFQDGRDGQRVFNIPEDTITDYLMTPEQMKMKFLNLLK